MSRKNYIKYKLELYYEIEKYFNSESNVNKNNYFYFINQENFNMLNNEFSFLSVEEKEFLHIYFKEDISTDEKIKLLKINSKNEYYNKYKKIISTIIKRG